MSYRKRVEDINRIYEEQAQLGLSNREIWRRFIYPRWGICERSFYNIISITTPPERRGDDLTPSLFDTYDI